jgi:hypothetical protein
MFQLDYLFCLNLLLSVNDEKLFQCCTSDLCYTDEPIIFWHVQLYSCSYGRNK